MDTEQKELLIDRFRAYLNTTELDPNENDEQTTDMYTLFVELAALKNEVKLESRQVKTALDEFKTVFELLRNNNQQLSEDLQRTRAVQQQQYKIHLRPLLLELLDFYDRLDAGLRSVRKYKPSLFARFNKRTSALIKAIVNGQEISLRRLEQLLSTQQVVSFSCIGKPLDPHTMKVVETAYRRKYATGIVLQELRKGFNWEGELLRAAEVKVNKHPRS